MSFDLFTQQQTLLSRLAPHAGAIVIADTFSPVDLTVEGAATVGAQLQFVEFSPVGQSGTAALHHARWSFDLYVDTGRASTADKTAACALFSNALAALIGWEVSPGRFISTADGQDNGLDGRVLRLSFGFNVPVYLAG